MIECTTPFRSQPSIDNVSAGDREGASGPPPDALVSDLLLDIDEDLLKEEEEEEEEEEGNCLGMYAVGGDCVCWPGKLRSVPDVSVGSWSSSDRVAANVLMASNAEDIVTILSLPASLSEILSRGDDKKGDTTGFLERIGFGELVNSCLGGRVAFVESVAFGTFLPDGTLSCSLPSLAMRCNSLLLIFVGSLFS